MRRRDFLAQLAAGLATAGFLLPGTARAGRLSVGVTPVGKRGRILAGELLRTMAGNSLAKIRLVDPNTGMPSRSRLDAVVVFGCLGGRTGLEDAADCERIVARARGGATAVVLWPMEFEGWRRHASAHLAAARIQAHGARLVRVMVPLPPGVTLDEARRCRERELLARGVQEVARFCA